MLLNPELLERAYRHGYFPMANPKTGEIAWYQPEPRAILPLDAFHVSRSLRRALRSMLWRISYDEAFLKVMRHCADRKEGTWMNEDFFAAYSEMHDLGKAHSVEVWEADQLVGGVYGVALGGAFFAESKFHRRTNASKTALYHLVERLKHCGYALLEVQFLTDHLRTLGATEVSAYKYDSMLQEALLLTPTAFAIDSRSED